MKWIVFYLALIVFFCGGVMMERYLGEKQVIYKEKKVYEFPGNILETCRNLLKEEKVNSCSSWQEGYREGYNAGYSK